MLSTGLTGRLTAALPVARSCRIALPRRCLVVSVKVGLSFAYDRCLGSTRHDIDMSATLSWNTPLQRSPCSNPLTGMLLPGRVQG